jgi:hypothetical protein
MLKQRLKKGMTLEEALTTPKYGKTVTDHLGNKYASLEVMASIYGINTHVLSSRLWNRWDLERALTTPVGNQNKNVEVKDHLGNSYNNLKDMCSHYHTSVKTYRTRLSQGMTIEQALTGPNIRNKKLVVDHLGNGYNSLEELADAYGIKYGALRSRLYLGWNLERALTTPVAGQSSKPKDHLGNSYNSIKDMCRHYGIPYGVYYNRLNQGMTIEQALTKPKEHIRGGHKRQIADHLGNQYDRLKDLADAYDISYGLLQSRLYHGWDIERALTTPVRESSKARDSFRDNESGSVKVKDHLGYEYKSITELADAYGLNECTLLYRLNHGWELERALNQPVITYKWDEKYVVAGHGNEPKSMRELAEESGLKYKTLIGRLKRGWDLERALSSPLNPEMKRHIVDAKGNEYESIQELSDAYGIDYASLYYRINHGWDIERALTVPVNKYTRKKSKESWK